MRNLKLSRKKDVSGVSGTGIIAEGVEFSSGQVVLHWLGKYSTIEVLNNINEVELIHGHDGSTEIIWE